MIQSNRFITCMVIVVFIGITFNIDAQGKELQKYNVRDLRVKLQLYPKEYNIRDLREQLQRYPMYVNAVDDNGYPLLINAVRSNDLGVVEAVLSAGADVNAVTKDGFTALHFAARMGHVEAIEWLVLHGADINAVDIEYQQTPMMYAFDVEAMESVEMLLDLGGDFATKDYRGYSVESF